MTEQQAPPSRAVDLSPGAGGRAAETFGRALMRRCPYCGGGPIFKGWFTLRERCPHCGTRYAAEDGYFLGAYPINLVLTSLIAVAVVIWLIAGTDLSVLQMQILAVVIVVGLPLLLYPYSLLLWMSIDLVLHPPGNRQERRRA
jgi:uncharacterized protein (DUF983 family)